ncbi:hypothetical protein ACROYT_G026120 [Oculina patagonica]
MTPTEASKKKKEGTVYFNLYGDMEPLSAKPKFKKYLPYTTDLQIKLKYSSVVFFVEGRKMEYPKKNPWSKDHKQLQTHILCWVWELNPDNIGERQALSPLQIRT